MLRYVTCPSPSHLSHHQLTHPPGIGVRLWQLGIEMRPFFRQKELWVYPFFGGIGGSFGYWLQGVEQRQMKILAERRDSLLAKRTRRAEREAKSGDERVEEQGVLAATS